MGREVKADGREGGWVGGREVDSPWALTFVCCSQGLSAPLTAGMVLVGSINGGQESLK